MLAETEGRKMKGGKQQKWAIIQRNRQEENNVRLVTEAAEAALAEAGSRWKIAGELGRKWSTGDKCKEASRRLIWKAEVCLRGTIRLYGIRWRTDSGCTCVQAAAAPQLQTSARGETQLKLPTNTELTTERRSLHQVRNAPGTSVGAIEAPRGTHGLYNQKIKLRRGK